MNDAPANLPALKMVESNPPDENQPVEPNRVTTAEGWTPARWLTVIALVFATQIALVFIFGEKKAIVPPAVKNVTAWKLANNSDELLALNDPTLFALPHQKDFASATWLKAPAVSQPSFHWTEAPQPLPFSAAGLGAVFGRFMPASFLASQPLDFKVTSELSTPTLPAASAPAQNSTMQVEGELARRQLPVPINLMNWPYADVIAPSKVQVLVGADGKVISTVLLPPENGFTAADYYDAANQRALEIARSVRFAPASNMAFGRIIFNWHTVPPETTTNAHE